MREIKFRAWYRGAPKYFTLKDISEWGPAWDGPGFDEHKDWEQYTGLRDKNGKEIYEGDILKDPHSGWAGKCEYNYSGFILKWNRGGYSAIVDWPEYEVIGNVHENPELLNEAV